MPRIRSIHPGQWTDEDFVTCSPLARLLALGLRNEADDQGTFPWKPLRFKLRLFPVDNVDVAELLDELAESGQVIRYEVDGKEYGAIRSFGRWQRVQRPTATNPLNREAFEALNLDQRWEFVDGQPSRFHEKGAPNGGDSNTAPGTIQEHSNTAPQPVEDGDTKPVSEVGGRREEVGGSKQRASAREAPAEPDPPAVAAAEAAPQPEPEQSKPPAERAPHEVPSAEGVAWKLFRSELEPAGIAAKAGPKIVPVLIKALESGWGEKRLGTWLEAASKRARKAKNPAGLLRKMLEEDLPSAAVPPPQVDEAVLEAAAAAKRAQADAERAEVRARAEAEKIAGVSLMRLELHKSARLEGSRGAFAREQIARNPEPSEVITDPEKRAAVLEALRHRATPACLDMAEAIEAEAEAQGRADASQERGERRRAAMHAPSKGGNQGGGPGPSAAAAGGGA